MNLGLKWISSEIGSRRKCELLDNDPLLYFGAMKTPAVFMFSLSSRQSSEVKKQNNELFRQFPDVRKCLVTYTEGAQPTTSASVLTEGFQALQRLLSGEEAAVLSSSRLSLSGGLFLAPRKPNTVCVIDQFD